ncbi:MAG TPA: 50S ribosomal protein L10 [Firmicutes bacterium]|nr:50S ribosomal protein L10 [Bacillota bacterium]HBN00725.1 50S ribosomal protein L10 [Bacillota bacterium]
MNATALQAKKNSVKEISEGLKSSKTIAIVSYQGLTVAETMELRRSLAEKNAKMGVYKNTLIRRALSDEGITGLDDVLEGPNALVFSEDVTSAAKILYKFARYHEHLVLRGGLVEGKVVDAKGMKEVAKLPTKEALLSMFCMVLNEPIAGFARVVNSINEKAGAEAPAAN